MQGIDFHQNDVLRIMVGHNSAPEQFLVTLPIQPAEQILQVGVQIENFAIRLR